MTTISVGNPGRNDSESRVLNPPWIPSFWLDRVAPHVPTWLSRQTSRHFGGIGCISHQVTQIRTRNRTL